MACSTSGGCSSEGSKGCSKHNTYNWLASVPNSMVEESGFLEIQIEGQFHKRYTESTIKEDFYRGDLVKLRAHRGFDIGQVTATGEIARLGFLRKQKDQKPGKGSNDEGLDVLLGKTNVQEETAYRQHLDKRLILQKKVRDIARNLALKVKVSDVVFRGDGRQATIYYTAEHRIDFREWVRLSSIALSTRVEMRQISDRQEAGIKGGLGPCGRELCCSSWMTKFDSVSTAAARYQQLAINNEKLAGQCGRLKCCLNFELQTYIEAKAHMPKRAKSINTTSGKYEVVSVDYLTKSIGYRSPAGELVVITGDDYKKLNQQIQEGKQIQQLFSASKTDPDRRKKPSQGANIMDMAVEGVDLDSFSKPPSKKSSKRRQNNQGKRRKKKPNKA